MKRKSLVIAGFIFWLGSEVASAETFTYVAWIHDEAISIETPKNGIDGEIVHATDATLESKFCDQISEYACVFSPIYAFAVPKAFDGSMRTWTVNNTTFEVAETDLTVSILGTTLSRVMLIRTPAEATLLGKQTSSPTFSLYSLERGLLAFRIPKSLEIYWLAGDQGFGRIE